jgi:hypothetical protein
MKIHFFLFVILIFPCVEQVGAQGGVFTSVFFKNQPGCTPGTHTFSSSSTLQIPSGCVSVIIKAWGQGGGTGYCNGLPDGDGGGGGYATGTFAGLAGSTLTIHVNVGQGAGFNIGGGYAGVLNGATPLVIAGGGGAGDANTTNPGGAGGGTTGLTGTGSNRGTGGTQTAGGVPTGGICGTWGGPANSGYLQASGGWSGGGGGYYGGGCAAGGGGAGGGSSYVAPTASFAQTTAGSGRSTSNTADPDYNGSAGVGAIGSDCGASNGNSGFVVVKFN